MRNNLKSFIFCSLITLTFTVFCFESCKKNDNPLVTLLNRIERIESVSCISNSKAFNVITESPLGSDNIYEEVFSNSDNSFMGVSYLYFLDGDKTKPDILYDGSYYVRLNWKKNSAIIEPVTDKNADKFPIPFLMKARLLLLLATSHPDSVKTEIKNYKDSTEIFLSFPNKLIEYYKSYPYIKYVSGSYTDFILMVSNKNHLPYKLTSVTPETKFTEYCTEIKASARNKKVLSVLDMIPDYFSRDVYNPYKKIALPGPDTYKASEWKLVEVEGDTISFNELKSKVILLEFTGLHCGPCNYMIPFLKRLVKEYKDASFELISIECESTDTFDLLRHKKKNGINYKYLLVDKKTKENYRIDSFPSLYFIDGNRMVKKCVIGYNSKETEDVIRNEINLLLHSN
jgi:thiol-disulfide isomerase/thioredoxin